MHQKRQDSAGAGDNISVKITGRDKQNMPRSADVKAAREAAAARFLLRVAFKCGLPN